MKKWNYSVSSADMAPTTAPLLLLGTPEENIKKAAELGYDAIEIHTREDADLDIVSIRKAMKSYDISISALVTGRLNTEGKCDLISDVPYIADACINGMLQYIDLAAQLETDIIIGWAKGNVPPGGNREKYMARLARNLKTIDNHAGRCGVKVMIEIINRYEVNIFTKADELMTFFEKHCLPNCYAHLDAFHMGIDECDPYEAIRRCRGRLGYFHLADNSRMYPGSGQFDFGRMLETLEEIGYDGYLSVECLPLPDGMEAAKRALDYMKKTERSKI